MARKRKHLPPFEVMGRPRLPLDEPPAPPPPVTPAASEPAYAEASAARPHFVVRIPQAYGLLLAAGLVGVVVLAYWLGAYNGGRAGHKSGYEQAQREYEAERQVQRRIGSVVAPGRAAGGETATAAAAEADNPYTEPRQPGLNYFVVARYPQAEALEARRFLKEHGVATFVQQDQNTPFYEVIATRGFEKVDAESRQFERELDRLGRLWKQQDIGPSEFDPYLRKFKGD